MAEKMKRIWVFCGCNLGTNGQYRQAAIELGRLLLDRELGLVYGGGSVGLMGVIADTILDSACSTLPGTSTRSYSSLIRRSDTSSSDRSTGHSSSLQTNQPSC
jgi:hypothetical protein